MLLELINLNETNLMFKVKWNCQHQEWSICT